MKKGEENQIIQFLLAEGTVRGAFIDSSKLVAETKEMHHLGPVETLITGQMMTAMALLTTTLKNNDREHFQIECGGPIGGLDADYNANGDVRGFLLRNPIVLDNNKEVTLDNLFGPGFLHFSRLSEGAKEPFTSTVELRYPDLASNLAYYFLDSEQTPSSFSLSIDQTPKGEYQGAAGLFLQLLPGADEKIGDQLQEILLSIKSLYKEMVASGDGAEWILSKFKDFNPAFIGVKHCRFYCPCSDEQIENFLKGLGQERVEGLKDENGNVSVKCHNCGENRVWTADKLKELFAK